MILQLLRRQYLALSHVFQFNPCQYPLKPMLVQRAIRLALHKNQWVRVIIGGNTPTKPPQNNYWLATIGALAVTIQPESAIQVRVIKKVYLTITNGQCA